MWTISLNVDHIIPPNFNRNDHCHSRTISILTNAAYFQRTMAMR